MAQVGSPIVAGDLEQQRVLPSVFLKGAKEQLELRLECWDLSGLTDLFRETTDAFEP